MKSYSTLKNNYTPHLLDSQLTRPIVRKSIHSHYSGLLPKEDMSLPQLYSLNLTTNNHSLQKVLKNTAHLLEEKIMESWCSISQEEEATTKTTRTSNNSKADTLISTMADPSLQVVWRAKILGLLQEENCQKKWQTTLPRQRWVGRGILWTTFAASTLDEWFPFSSLSI